MMRILARTSSIGKLPSGRLEVVSAAKKVSGGTQLRQVTNVPAPSGDWTSIPGRRYRLVLLLESIAVAKTQPLKKGRLSGPSDA